jgi:16S rRNA (adenine1518-N6/adenine1519-N6)-dimethyltransferase
VTLTRRQVASLLAQHALRPSRALGQHFVADPNTVRRVARLAGVGPSDHVVEVGPGLGSLTLALAETGAAVTAVEADRRLLPVLRSVLASASLDQAVTVVEGDAMSLDWSALLAGVEHWTLVANLPYSIATPLVANLLDGVPAVERMLVMVQREVAERLVARPGDPSYGAVSVKVAYWAEAKLLGQVPPTVFLPRPHVESALVSIRRREVPPPVELLFPLVRLGFSGRRKMLRRSLAGVVTPAAFESAGVSPEARAEDLDVVAWERLAVASSACADVVRPSPSSSP